MQRDKITVDAIVLYVLRDRSSKLNPGLVRIAQGQLLIESKVEASEMR